MSVILAVSSRTQLASCWSAVLCAVFCLVSPRMTHPLHQQGSGLVGSEIRALLQAKSPFFLGVDVAAGDEGDVVGLSLWWTCPDMSGQGWTCLDMSD